MSEPLIQVRNLLIEFVNENGSTPAVKNISFSVMQGEITAIVGESGSGKSVTALSILQLLPPASSCRFSGSIMFNDGDNPVDLLTEPRKKMRRIRGNRISMIFQEPMSSLNPVFTCGNQVTEAIRTHRKISAAEAKRQAIGLFNQVKLPDPAAIFDRYPHQLSGGQKQRVMIAMAISCKPALLICDEPTTALDVTVQKTILELIRELQQQSKMAVIFITHDLGLVAEIADRVIVLYKGEVVEEGAVETLFRNPKHPYTRALLQCRPGLHPRGERLPVVADYMEEDEAGIIISRERSNRGSTNPLVSKSLPYPLEENLPDKKQLIRVQGLSVSYPSKMKLFGYTPPVGRAVDDISFDIFEGETLGIVGESGCGKTTLGKCLLRLITPDSRKVLFNGNDLFSYNSADLKKLRKDIQIIFQDPFAALNPRLSIGTALGEPLQVHHILQNRQQRRDAVIGLLEKVNLDALHIDRYPHEFSGGQRQRIVIARALALSPSFIVCDEPVSALDVSVQAQVLNLLNDLKKEYGFTVVFISHDLSVVGYISDRIMVMNKGKIEEIGNADEVYERPKKEYTKKLLASIPHMEKE